MNLPKYITDERTGLKYELIGDYYFIAGDDEESEDNRPIGRWGRMHEDYLKKNKRHVLESHSKGQSGNRLRCSPLGLRRFPYFKRFLADFHAFPELFQESLVLSGCL